MEAIGNWQTVVQSANIVFDPNSTDSVGNNIVLNELGTVFTINQTGLYQIDWGINLAPESTSAAVGIMENAEAASGSASSAAGNFSSGTLVYVDTVPFAISLYNYANEIVLRTLHYGKTVQHQYG